jgi:predicted nucleic acid-binding protein
MKTYIETSVLTDWFFVRTMKSQSRRKLRHSVHESYLLVERILEGHFPLDKFVTATWAILEAIGSLKRSRIQFNMLTQSVNLGYYDTFKDKKGYRLEPYQIREIRRLIDNLASEKHMKNLPWSNLLVDLDSTLRFIILGLDPPDALHAAIAKDERCEGFVTRDTDFLQRKDVLSKWFEVLEPRTIAVRLDERRKVRPRTDKTPMPR